MRKKVCIGDLGTIITGNTPPRNRPELYGNHTPFIKATDISESEKYTYNPEECYSEEGYNKYIKSLIPKGSTCVVTIGSIGKKMTMAHCDLFINQAMNAIIPNACFDSEYVYYAVKNVLGNIKTLDSGTASGRENVSKSAFSKMEIWVEEELPIQQRIATILSRYDSLIENYQKQIKLLEESAQRLYKEWFIDLRFPGHENTKIVDGVPEGWEEKSIMEVFDFKYGKILPIKDFVKDGPIPVYGASKQIGRYTNANCFEPKVLIGSRGNAGFVHRTIEDETYVTNNSFIVEPCANYGYLKMPFIFESFKVLDFVAICTGAAQPQLTLNSISSLKYIVPMKDLIISYCDITTCYFSKIALAYKQINLLTEARDRLLPKLMSGEINV